MGGNEYGKSGHLSIFHWRKSRGGGGDGGDTSPHFFGWGGWPVQISPPLFEDEITLNLTFIV